MSSSYYEEGVRAAEKNKSTCPYNPPSYEYSMWCEFLCPYDLPSYEYDEWVKGWDDRAFDSYMKNSKEYFEGYEIGILTEDQSNPYPPDSKEGEDWIRGFKDGLVDSDTSLYT